MRFLLVDCDSANASASGEVVPVSAVFVGFAFNTLSRMDSKRKWAVSVFIFDKLF